LRLKLRASWASSRYRKTALSLANKKGLAGRLALIIDFVSGLFA
jgi:hypothetical protein